MLSSYGNKSKLIYRLLTIKNVVESLTIKKWNLKYILKSLKLKYIRQFPQKTITNLKHIKNVQFGNNFIINNNNLLY